MTIKITDLYKIRNDLDNERIRLASYGVRVKESKKDTAFNDGKDKGLELAIEKINSVIFKEE